MKSLEIKFKCGCTFDGYNDISRGGRRSHKWKLCEMHGREYLKVEEPEIHFLMREVADRDAAIAKNAEVLKAHCDAVETAEAATEDLEKTVDRLRKEKYSLLQDTMTGLQAGVVMKKQEGSGPDDFRRWEDER